MKPRVYQDANSIAQRKAVVGSGSDCEIGRSLALPIYNGVCFAYDPTERATTGQVTAMEKVVVLAAGKGSRMQRNDSRTALAGQQSNIAAKGIKALIPIDRPFLDYVLSNVAEAGYKNVCLVIGPNHDALREYCQHLSGGRLQIEYAVQQEPLGTAHALLAAAEFTADNPFLLINSDNFYPVAALRALREMDGCGTIGFDRQVLVRQGNIPADRVASFSVMQADAQGWLTGIVEKPTGGIPNGSVSMNCWRFELPIYEACRQIDPSTRGELEIPSAVMHSMQQLGQRYRILPSTEPVLDMSLRSDIASAAKYLRDTVVRL